MGNAKTEAKKHFIAQQRQMDLKTLSDLIVTAIEEEQFFNKKVLIPKVKAIISGFKLNLSSAKYNAIESPSDGARRIRTIEKQEFELNFWKTKMKEQLHYPEMFNVHCQELNDKLTQAGFK